MIKRALSLILIAMVVLVPLGILVTAPPTAGQINSLPALEGYLKENFVFGSQLRDMAARLTISVGQTQRDGLFYTKDGLVEDYWPVAADTVQKGNTEAIIDFAQRGDVPTFAMVIPTAVAIKQKMVPEKAPLYNQKTFIEGVYSDLSGHVTAIDVYPVLYQRYDATGDYLYYRTEHGPTALGGYLIYSEAADRMRQTPYSLQDFSKEYPVHDYYGNLYSQWSYKEVQGDIFTIYRYTKKAVGYNVTSTSADGIVTAYRTLFPLQAVELGEPSNVYLGGLAPRIDIEVVREDPGNNLLVFGDDTAMSYLPFLALHYGKVTFIDLDKTARAQLEELDVTDYDQVLFAYSLDTYRESTAIQKVRKVSWES